MIRYNKKRIQFVLLSFAVLFLTNCEESTKTNDKKSLLEGKWEITAVDGKKIKTKEGIQFAPNRQYFSIDSQGKSVPRLIEKIWDIKGDTLTMIDYNWEPEFIEKKGTFIYKIDSLSEKTLRLRLINKEEEQTITYNRR